MSAAASARRVDPSAEIVVFEQGDHVSYAACGIPYYISGLQKDIQGLVVYTPDYFERERNIRVLTGHEVLEIEQRARRVIARNRQDGSIAARSYDSLILATGAAPRVPAIPGLDGERCFTVRDLHDAIRLNDYLDNERPGHGLILGGGWIGVIFAEAFLQRGIRVTLLEKEDHILAGFDREIAAIVEAVMKGHGVAVEKSVSLRECIAHSHTRSLTVKTQKGDFHADFLLSAAGVAPRNSLMPGTHLAGVPIPTDDRMRTSHEGIYACGDCTSAYNLVAGRYVYHPLGTTANKQGRVAGENAGGRHALFGGILGTQAVKVFELEVARTGLTSAEAKKMGLKTIEAITTSPSRARYVPGGSPITTKVIVEPSSGRILGAQMAGLQEVAKRIDIFVPMLHNRMTVRDAVTLDISYTPQCSPLWDPVLFCLRKAQEMLERG